MARQRGGPSLDMNGTGSRVACARARLEGTQGCGHRRRRGPGGVRDLPRPGWKEMPCGHRFHGGCLEKWLRVPPPVANDGVG
ncbi:hypothetical protein E2562_012306 [Oryza meyeriana var. granulata]|uniref:Zinc finger C3HC4 RING-type domain-containing protein n=1 Tax=Oryza meyeriana var. granulata TaxID=110450 RepID=A0A6G1DH40_9ORYZ|nr:hypothetical protein E2562_012306 [Oryza meyeriana var. granulata]